MPENPKLRRRYERISTPKGLWVAWEYEKRQQVSRVRDLNAGGLFVATPVPAPSGATVQILLNVAEGQIKGQAVVRNVTPREGMGIEFKDLTTADAERLDRLISRLLKNSTQPA
jgi:hypothetical protein